MRFAFLAAVAGVATASPAPAPAPALIDPRVVHPLNELVVRDPMEVIHAQHGEHLEKRISADFSLDHEWNNEVLFDGTWNDAEGDLSDTVSLKVNCVECWTKGTVTAKLTTEDIFEPVIRLSFQGVEAYVDVDVATSAAATYAINLFSTDSPLGLSIPGLEVGLVFSIDLVFSVTAKIDLEGGFYVKLADDAYLETDIFTGDITDHFFDGIATKSIPVTVFSGAATFKADLRLRVQAGAEADLDIIGIGAGAVVGIYANILEFVAVLDWTPTCELQTREWFDLNVGAYARVSVAIDHSTTGLVPTVSTTFFNSPTFTQCWIDGSPAESGVPGVSTTRAPVSSDDSVVRTISLPTGGSPTSTVSTVLVSTLPGTGVSSFTSQPRPTYTPGHSLPLTNSSVVESASLVTSTVYSTSEYTITSCAASVVNCPASWQKHIVVTKTVDAFTTVCPAGASVTYPAAPAATGAPKVAAVHVITELVVLSKVERPVAETFVAPTAGMPTVHQVTAVLPAPTTVVLPVVDQVNDDVVNNGEVTKVLGFQNSTSAAPSTTSHGAAAGTGSLTTTSSLAPTVPVSAAGQLFFDGFLVLALCCGVSLASVLA